MYNQNEAKVQYQQNQKYQQNRGMQQIDAKKAKFEQEIKARIQHKARSVQDEPDFLRNSLKFFALNNSLGLNQQNFEKAIERIGVNPEQPIDYDSIYRLYERNDRGELLIHTFVNQLYQLEEFAVKNQKKNTKASEVFNKLRERLNARGAKGYIGLVRQFKIMDDDNSKTLSKQEFNKAMLDFGLDFDKASLDLLFKEFDVNQDGSLSFDEFVRGVRGNMSQQRQAIVMKAFKKFDKDGSKVINVHDLSDGYDVSKHPDFISKKKTKDQILKEFLLTFEIAHNTRMGNHQPDGQVTEEEFLEYYQGISANIDDDKYFFEMMNKCWALTKEYQNVQGFGGKPLQWEFRGNDNKTPIATRDHNILNLNQYNKKGQKKEDVVTLNASEEQILQFIRDSLKARGARSIVGMGRKFKIIDNNNNKSLDKHEFKQVMQEMRLYLSDAQLKTAFETFDRNRDGAISYEEFLRAIVGNMNDFRRKFVEKAFKIIDVDNDQVLTVKDIKEKYNADFHPDVISGKKTEWDVYEEFLGTFEQHFCDKHGNESSRDRKVTFEEFVEYYNHISMSIDDDKYFELMMVNAWKLDPAGQSNQLKIGWSNTQHYTTRGKNAPSLKDKYQASLKQTDWDNKKNQNHGYAPPTQYDAQVEGSGVFATRRNTYTHPKLGKNQAAPVPKKYEQTTFGQVSGPARTPKSNTFGVTDKTKFY